MGASFTSCSSDKDLFDPQANATKILQDYQTAFINVFGTPAADQTWGFGEAPAASRMTRAESGLPDKPTFRDNNPMTKPEVSSAYKNTLAEAIAAGAKYAKNYQNYQTGDIIYIDTDYQTLNNPQNTSDLTIYVDGNVTYGGDTNQNGNGTVFCVTENSTLTLNSVSNRLIVYLAPKATLNITQRKDSWSGQQHYEWPNGVQTADNTFTFQNDPAAIYMSTGSVVNAADLKLVNGVKVLNDGGTITADNITLDQNSMIWNEGSITVENNMVITNTSSMFYNKTGKTVTVKGNLDLINNDALLYNEGTVNVTGAITTHNTNAEVINNGTLTGASYNQKAGGKMHNVGIVTIDGKTDLTNSNSSWVNDGQYTTGSFDIDNYSVKNFNNCKLTVKGKFFLNRGKFVLNGGASVVCDSFTWEDTSNFYLYSKSMLKVNGTLLTNNYNSGYGFRGIGDEYAVIQAKKIAKGKGDVQFSMSYFGKLYIATNDHFAQGALDPMNTPPAQPYYYYENTVKFEFDGDDSPVSIDESDCCPGFRRKVEPQNPSLRVIAEDLTAGEKGDFDFNDVVFDAEYIDANKVKVTIYAAGGTLPLRVDGKEVHDLFKTANPNATTDQGGEINTMTMINTNARFVNLKVGSSSAELPNKPEFYITNQTWNSDANLFAADVRDKIKIIVTKTDEAGNEYQLELTAEQGKTPGKVGVGTSYEWKNEREYIGDEFKKFVTDPGNTMWWKK